MWLAVTVSRCLKRISKAATRSLPNYNASTSAFILSSHSAPLSPPHSQVPRLYLSNTRPTPYLHKLIIFLNECFCKAPQKLSLVRLSLRTLPCPSIYYSLSVCKTSSDHGIKQRRDCFRFIIWHCRRCGCWVSWQLLWNWMSKRRDAGWSANAFEPSNNNRRNNYFRGCWRIQSRQWQCPKLPTNNASICVV